MALDDDSATGTLDKFGQPYFTPQGAVTRRSGEPTRDEFGHTPFAAASQGRTPVTGHSHSDDTVDEFGAPRFTPRSTSQQSNSSRSRQDMFGARPFVQSTDAFGATPFVTS